MNKANRYYRPETIDQALRCAEELQMDFKFLAGGTDLWVNKKQENETAKMLIDLTGLEELKRVSLEDGKLMIGALAVLDGIASHEYIGKSCPVLFETIESIASPVI
ncbi:MAG TPA: FAD binding domain-containing protein, partial [Saprospiraceae bacterium]|nr:FAD binding domain-containing protein [Saprospiraceae bacterium]